jgi:hypothetical protein
LRSWAAVLSGFQRGRTRKVRRVEQGSGFASGSGPKTPETLDRLGFWPPTAYSLRRITPEPQSPVNDVGVNKALGRGSGRNEDGCPSQLHCRADCARRLAAVEGTGHVISVSLPHTRDGAMAVTVSAASRSSKWSPWVEALTALSACIIVEENEPRNAGILRGA